MLTTHRCRFCSADINQTFIDLGISPLSNKYLMEEDLDQQEVFYPLHARICDQCLLVQLPEFESPKQIFSDYAYFSSYSDSWLTHSQKYTEMMTNRFNINHDWEVIEIASNDGYLLQYFKEKHIPVFGIEPAKNVAQAAINKGIPTLSAFFGHHLAQQLVQERKKANLLIGNNVLAHVPDLNDFVMGLKILLAPCGILTLEFPHLFTLISENQFDTIYHEHFSYFSLLTVQKVFAHHQLIIFDVEEIPVHGGSLRLFIKHREDERKVVSENIERIIAREKEAGLDKLKTYQCFNKKVRKIKQDLLAFMLKAKGEGKLIAGYGAPAKGNTLLNYCGIKPDFLPCTVDKNPYKQGRFLPGTRIPVFHPEKIKELKPDYLLLLPWNLKNEIIEQMQYIREWGGQFITAIPNVQMI